MALDTQGACLLTPLWLPQYWHRNTFSPKLSTSWLFLALFLWVVSYDCWQWHNCIHKLLAFHKYLNHQCCSLQHTAQRLPWWETAWGQPCFYKLNHHTCDWFEFQIWNGYLFSRLQASMFTGIHRGMCCTIFPSVTNLVNSTLSCLHDVVIDKSNLMTYSQNYKVSIRLLYTSDNQPRRKAWALDWFPECLGLIPRTHKVTDKKSSVITVLR